MYIFFFLNWRGVESFHCPGPPNFFASSSMYAYMLLISLVNKYDIMGMTVADTQPMFTYNIIYRYVFIKTFIYLVYCLWNAVIITYIQVFSGMHVLNLKQKIILKKYKNIYELKSVPKHIQLCSLRMTIKSLNLRNQ